MKQMTVCRFWYINILHALTPIKHQALPKSHSKKIHKTPHKTKHNTPLFNSTYYGYRMLTNDRLSHYHSKSNTELWHRERQSSRASIFTHIKTPTLHPLS